VGDITYLPIADGSNLSLATCIDLGSRKLTGWAMADHMGTVLVEDRFVLPFASVDRWPAPFSTRTTAPSNASKPHGAERQHHAGPHW
jgi:transposase InsO family protein